MIARAFGRHPVTVAEFIRDAGGIRPPRTQPSRMRLSLHEREEISRDVAAGESLRAIATRLGRAPSTVSREVARNGGRRGYRALRADRATKERARRAKPCKLATCPRLATLVKQKLKAKWSPEQIAGWLARSYGDNDEMRVSHETIYRTLYVQSHGVFAPRTHPAPAHPPQRAPPQSAQGPQGRRTRPAHGDRAHLPAARRGRRPGRTRPLRRRPAARQGDVRHRHPRRAHVTVHDAHQARQHQVRTRHRPRSPSTS